MSKQKVKVVVRVRPPLEEEDNNLVEVVDEKTLQMVNHRNTETTLKYEFERVFNPKAPQMAVYNDCVRPIVKHTLQGQNSSVFAYGPTGAGKTHTILGSAKDPGVIPRCVKDIFILLNEEKISTQQMWDYTVSFSYLEIYQEKVHDLLDLKPVDLPIREDQLKNIFVTGLSEQKINNVQEFNEAFAPASKNRTTAATKLNERSSRSHSLLMLKIFKSQNVAPFRKLTGKMYIIDLAGSEDNRKTGNHGIRLKESGAINSSLLALGQVVDALNKGQTCVPYRSSKLTRLLQDCLGGNSHATMIVNLAPEEKYYFDTYTTLLFARKTKKIVNTIRTNEIKDKPKPAMKRSLSADLQIKKKKNQQGMTYSDRLDVTPPKKLKTDPQPFLSPLLKNQEKFKAELQKEMFSRLEMLESRILQQMVQTPTVSHSQENETVLPDSTTDDEESKSNTPHMNKAMDRLDSLIDRMEGFKKKGFLETPVKALDETPVNSTTYSGDIMKKEKVYSDGSKSNHYPLTDISNSPLFLRPSVLKRKGFKSTAQKEVSEISIPVEKDEQQKSEAQLSHNERILNILNTGSVKDLQDLQTVGTKRANLIHSWRGIHGPYAEFHSLTEVPGLTSKYMSSFLKSNLVQL